MDLKKRTEEHYKAFTDFWWFLVNVLGYRGDKSIDYYDLVSAHKDLADFLVKPGKAKLVLNPRESLKSQIVTCGYALWRLVRNPNLRILIYSDSAGKAQGFLQNIKFHIEGKAPNSRFREFYPRWETDPHKGGTYNESRVTVRSREHEQKEPSIDTGGIETSKVGNHYDIVFFDDIVSDVNITTKAQMDKVAECYKKSLSLLKRGGEKILVGTRWHYGDVYGRILDENKETGEFETFITDAYQERDGKVLYHDIGMTLEWLGEQKRKQGSYLHSCLYRNSPVDDETAIFKESSFSWYRPGVDYKNLYITCACDPAGEGEDFTAITVVGTDSQRRMYLLDAINDHLKPDQIINKIINLSYKYPFDRFAIEKNFYKGMLEKELRAAVDDEARNEMFKPFSVEEVTASAKNRTFARVLALQPYHERGALLFPNNGETVNTLDKVFSELAFQMLQFTIDGSKSPHDDLLVSLSLHSDIISLGGEPEEEKAPVTSAAWFEEQQMKELKDVPVLYRRRFTRAFN